MRTATHYFGVRSVVELLLGLVDVLFIMVRGRPSGLGWQQGETVVPDVGRIREYLPAHPPRVFTMELYYAHLQGASTEEISRKLEVPAHWVRDRLDAARECLEFELPERRVT